MGKEKHLYAGTSVPRATFENGGTILISSWNFYCLKAHPVYMKCPWNTAGLL